MISWELAEKQLDKAKKDFNYIEDSVDKFVTCVPFIVDCYGVPSTELYKLVEHQVEDVFLAINPGLTQAELDDIVGYYIWEGDFGGYCENKDGKGYDLKDIKQLMEYLRSEY